MKISRNSNNPSVVTKGATDVAGRQSRKEGRGQAVLALGNTAAQWPALCHSVSQSVSATEERREINRPIISVSNDFSPESREALPFLNIPDSRKNPRLRDSFLKDAGSLNFRSAFITTLCNTDKMLKSCGCHSQMGNIIVIMTISTISDCHFLSLFCGSVLR